MRPTLALTILGHRDPGRVGERAFLHEGAEPLFRAHQAATPRPLGAPLPLPVEGGRITVDHPLIVDAHTVVLPHLVPPHDERRDASDLGLVGASAALERIRRAILRVAPLDLPVLLRGPTGSGKEVVARALHAQSARRHGPSIAVNMGALSPGLAPSEMFGHARGAFTGAQGEHLGHLRSADGGTLFLDEIGEASLEVQALLLRALETQHVQPVGGSVAHPVDVRLVAATDLDLGRALAEGRFRPALYYRLAGYELTIPPLRERPEDVACLLVHFMGGQSLPPPLLLRLLAHDWPGNVRQLRHAAQQLLLADHPAEVVDRLTTARPSMEPARRPADISADEVFEAMRKSAWRIERAATLLGVSRMSMYRLIAAHPELRIAKDLDREELLRSYRETGGRLEEMSELLRVSLPAIRGRMKEMDQTIAP